MKKVIFVILALFLLATTAQAGWVKGYYRKDGTHVRGHYRSNPNSTKSDNYGRPSASDKALGVPAWQRDYDGDGIPNSIDWDDDNDGIEDDRE